MENRVYQLGDFLSGGTMSLIQKTLRFEGSQKTRFLEALFDSGSTYSMIRRDVAESIATLESMQREMCFETADQSVQMVAKYRINSDFYLGPDRFSDEFIVLDDLSEEVIIGAKTLQSWRMKLDFENDEVIYDPKVTRLKIVSLRTIGIYHKRGAHSTNVF